MKIKRPLVALAILASAAFGGGCARNDPATFSEGEDGGSHSAIDALSTRVDAIDLLRGTISYSYTGYADPSAMLAAVDVALVGEVVSLEGALIEGGLEPHGALIIGLTPIDEWKREVGKPGDVVHYWIDRPKNVDAAIYETALPVGTEVAFFGFDAHSTSDVKFLTDVPEVVFAPAPQGLFLPDVDDALVNVWGEGAPLDAWASLDSLPALKRAALAGHGRN